MSHEGDGHPLLPIEPLFEREDDEHALDRTPYLAHATAPPRPHLRRDVVDDGNSAALQLGSEPQVEVGVIDEYGQVRPLAVHFREHAPEDAAEPPKMTHDLEEAHDGQ